MANYPKRATGADGTEFRSGFESKVADELLKHSVDFSFEEHQLQFKKKVIKSSCDNCGSKEVYQHRTYTPDFYLPELGFFIETKGRFVSKDRTKMLAVIKCNPDLDIRMYFQQDNKLTKGKDDKYSDWCIKHGVTYCIGSIPEEWLNG